MGSKPSSSDHSFFLPNCIFRLIVQRFPGCDRHLPRRKRRIFIVIIAMTTSVLAAIYHEALDELAKEVVKTARERIEPHGSPSLRRPSDLI